jgi:hypothetical protein
MTDSGSLSIHTYINFDIHGRFRYHNKSMTYRIKFIGPAFLDFQEKDCPT